MSPIYQDSRNGSFNSGTGSFHASSKPKPARVSIFRSGSSVLSQEAPVPVVEWESLVGQQFLGSGEFCSVWGAELEGKRVAVKVLNAQHAKNRVAVADLESETKIMIALQHHGIVSVLGVGQTDDQPFLVLDILTGTLAAALPKPVAEASFYARRSGVKRWPLLRALSCGLELSEVLRYCHDDALPGFQLLHRDLKPDNIGFRPDGTLVLFDFGLAKLWKIDPNEPGLAAHNLSGQTGSARYMAPEVATSQPYGSSAEVYSVGIILWQLASHDRPFAGMNMDIFRKKVIVGGGRPPLKKGWPAPFARLLSDCWDDDPARRPLIAEVCRRLGEMIVALGGAVEEPRHGKSSAYRSDPPE